MSEYFSLYVNGDLTTLNERLATGWQIERNHTQNTVHGILYVLHRYVPDSRQEIGIDVAVARVEREIATISTSAPVAYTYTPTLGR